MSGMLFTFRLADTHGDLIWNDVLFRYRLGGLSCLFLSAQATHSDQEENRTFSGELRGGCGGCADRLGSNYALSAARIMRGRGCTERAIPTICF